MPTLGALLWGRPGDFRTAAAADPSGGLRRANQTGDATAATTFDIIRFVTRPSKCGRTWVVIPVINNVQLPKLLKPIERSFAAAEGHAELAGAYDGVWFELFHRSRAELLGAAGDGEKVTVLDCPCGNPECWPFLVRVTATADDIRWSDYEQWHRNFENCDRPWRYAALRPFRFGRAEYEAALDAVPMRPWDRPTRRPLPKSDAGTNPPRVPHTFQRVGKLIATTAVDDTPTGGHPSTGSTERPDGH